MQGLQGTKIASAEGMEKTTEKTKAHHRSPEARYAGKTHHAGKAHYAGTDRLTAEGRAELPDSDFGLPRERKFPMPDAAHVRAAESYFHYAPDDEKPGLARRILQKAREFGVEVHSPTVLHWAGN
jgi:hypothetical protein